MSTLSRDILSEKDRAVLDSIFDPTFSGNGIVYDKHEVLDHLQDDEGEITSAVEHSRKTELEAIAAAENGDYEKACDLFEISMDLAPHRAAPYNNRAQVYRIQGDNDAAMEDLNKALKLCKSSGRTGCRALCQRGVLKRLKNDIEGARADFEEAAKLGSQFAKSQLVEINPYSAMCNQMLRQAMDKLN
ncbi:tetratricopeptide repeat protein 36 homolog [Culicoides brevitarsis]|uniref:tetratricopeptide repeat protein 36 homolog n=1 Tax=Culicoides brevitarsis TaxID=469753 RepID=UPI00307BF4BA